uniref:Uncharacterized protein n=1 Tax=Timema tahoe TaxID=61484 RepID=A0A7R9NVX1_9NEOP|nr:unnamed protein product [Timema tahoe]
MGGYRHVACTNHLVLDISLPISFFPAQVSEVEADIFESNSKFSKLCILLLASQRFRSRQDSSPQTTSRHVSCSRPIQDLKSPDRQTDMCQATGLEDTEGIPGQVEWSCTHIHIDVLLGELADMFLQGVPRIPVEPSPHLGCHVRQQEGLVHMTLVQPVVSRRSKMASVEPTALVVRVVRPENTDGRVHPSENQTSISPSSVVWLNTPGALANYATEAGGQTGACERATQATLLKDRTSSICKCALKPEQSSLQALGNIIFDTDTKDDMEATIKSEPDNYKYLPVKIECLFDGFPTISEKIKVETDTQEDVVIVIKSEQDNYKSCHVKLERLSNNFIIMRTKLKKHQGNLNLGCLPVQAKGGSRPKCWKYGGTRAWKKCKEEECSKKAKGGDVIGSTAVASVATVLNHGMYVRALALVSIHITEYSPAVETIRRSHRLPAFLPSGARFAFLKMGTTPSGGGCGERGGENSSNSQDKLTTKSMLPPPQVALLVEM